MVMLVSLEQASDHLRRDTDDDDADLTLKIQAASAAVLGYLGDDAEFLDSDGNVEGSDGDPEVPQLVQNATLLVIGDYYRRRDGTDADGLNQAARDMLALYGRKPTMV